jgi:anthranilate phosphoribosyltransferase
MQKYLKQLLEGVRLSEAELELVFNGILNQEYLEEEIKEFLLALTDLGECELEILTLVRILRKMAKKIKSPVGAIDVCGTGGDGKNTLNISTAVAFVLASLDVPVAKHGNRAVSSRSGSSDVLSELKVNIEASSEKMEKALFETNVCFLFAPKYHKILASVAKIRQEMGVRTIFNLLGPLLNPAFVKRQLIGVFKKELLPIYANVVCALDYERVMVVSSLDGLDEISVCAETEIWDVKNGEIKSYVIKPEDFGIKRYDLKELEGGDAKYNGEKMTQLFEGRESAYFDAVLLNSAFALVVAGKFNDVKKAIEPVREVMLSGKVLDKLNELIKYLK